MICAETSAVYMAGKPIKVKDTEVTSGPSYSVLVSDQLLHHYVYYIRLYLLGTYKEPKKKELEGETSTSGAMKKNTKQDRLSSNGKTQQKSAQKNENSSTCVIL